jgi:hypothetical protein
MRIGNVVKRQSLEGWALPVALAALNALVIGTWVRWLMRASDPATAAPLPSVLLMFGLILAGTITARIALAGRWSIHLARLAVLLLGLLTLVGATAWLYGPRFPGEYWRGLLMLGNVVTREFLWLLAAPWLWWRGVQNFHSRVPHETLAQTFWWGAVWLALALAANGGYPVLDASEVTGVTLVYFIVGMIALAIMSLERARRRQKEAAGVALALNRHWLGTLVAIITLMLGMGVALVEVLAPGVAPVRTVVSAVWTPVAQLLGLILALLAWPFLALMERLPRPQFNLPTPIPTQQGGVAPPPLLAEEQVVTTVTVLDIVFIVALLALALWLVLRRLRPPPAAHSSEVRENVFSRALLMDQLRGWLSRFRPKSGPVPPYLALTGGADDPRRRIRQTYQALLAWASQRGLRRAPGETPALFLQRLAQAAPQPGGLATIDVLTRAYERARYAGEADAPTLADAAEAEWAVGEITADRRG